MSDRARILNSANLPSLPDVAVRLMQVSAEPDAGMRDVVAVVRADPGMSTRIIKAVNSPYFGLNAEVSSIEGAVPLLGTSTVISLALSFSLICENQTAQLKTLWSQSLLKAVTAEYIARKKGFSAPCDFFLAGLLQDVGMLAMLNTIVDEYAPIVEQAANTSSAICGLEVEKLGFNHIDIGVDLTRSWSMPNSLVEAIRYHHEEFDAIEACQFESYYPLIKTVRFATCISDYLTFAEKDKVRVELQACGARFFGFDDQQLDAILMEVRQQTDEASTVMSIDTGQLPRPTELLAAANARLVDINVRNQMAMSQLAQKNDELKEQTVHDGLTGVHNRLAFDDRYRTTVQACLDNGGTAGVIFCDIDKFKDLNDTYGHPFGDEVLKRVAKTFEASVRDTDFVARYGGEEFVVVAVECDGDHFAVITERLRTNTEAEVIHFEGQRVPVTVSIGACFATSAVAKEFAGDIADEMLQQADAAMYRCKHRGRNRAEVLQITTTPGDDSIPSTSSRAESANST